MIAALEVLGPFRGISGYDRHTRAFVRQFARLGVRVNLTQDEGWSDELPDSERDRWFDDLRANVGADVLLHFTMPNRARPRSDRRNVNYTMFEADRIPQEWVTRAAEHDLVVVPTEACRAAWMESGVLEERVRVSPLGVDPTLSEPCPALPLRDHRGREVSTYSHRFLNVAELRPRKNLLGLLRAWMMGTRAGDDAVLILKATVFQQRALPQFVQDLAQMQQRLGRKLADAAPVVLIAERMSHEQIRALYRAATHYVSLSHGEGWDMVMTEAAVSGLQLIAPRHTAYVEYLREDDAELIPSRLAPATFDGAMGAEDRMFFDGLRWWEPDEEAAATLFREIIAGRRARKRSPASRLVETYAWERVAAQLLSTIDEALFAAKGAA